MWVPELCSSSSGTKPLWSSYTQPLGVVLSPSFPSLNLRNPLEKARNRDSDICRAYVTLKLKNCVTYSSKASYRYYFSIWIH